MTETPTRDPQNTNRGQTNSGNVNILAAISLIAGLLSIFLFWLGPLQAPLLAVVLGHIARGQIKRSNNTQGGAGIALAGLILGYIMIVASIVAVVIIGVFFVKYLGT